MRRCTCESGHNGRPRLSQRAGVYERGATRLHMPFRSYLPSISLMRVANIAAALALATLVAGCGDNASQQKQGGAPPAPQVTVAKPTQRTVSDYGENVGLSLVNKSEPTRR